MDDPLPIPPGAWDKPQPVTALPEDLMDFVSVLIQFGDRLPKLITALDQLRRMIPEFARGEITGEITATLRAAMIALCREPARILADLAVLCEQQATPPRAGGLIEGTR